MRLPALINSSSWLQWFRVLTYDKPSKGRTVQCSSLKPASKPAWFCQAALSWTSRRLNTLRRGPHSTGVHRIPWAPALVTRTPGVDPLPPVIPNVPPKASCKENLSWSQKGCESPPDTSKTKWVKSLTWGSGGRYFGVLHLVERAWKTPLGRNKWCSCGLETFTGFLSHS